MQCILESGYHWPPGPHDTREMNKLCLYFESTHVYLQDCMHAETSLKLKESVTK